MTGLQRILLVEDDADIRSIISLSLTAFGGFDVVAVADGPAGIQAAATASPDLVILDYMMPGLNGIETLRALRAQADGRRALPAIFITAAIATQRMSDIREPAVLGVIAKPFDAVGLASEVQRMWDEHFREQ